MSIVAVFHHILFAPKLDLKFSTPYIQLYFVFSIEQDHRGGLERWPHLQAIGVRSTVARDLSRKNR